MPFIDTLRELYDWLVALPAEFVFLLALPFAVGALGLLRVTLARGPVAADERGWTRTDAEKTFRAEVSSEPTRRGTSSHRD